MAKLYVITGPAGETAALVLEDDRFILNNKP